jgi:hypothetical protein
MTCSMTVGETPAMVREVEGRDKIDDWHYAVSDVRRLKQRDAIQRPLDDEVGVVVSSMPWMR